MMARYLGPPIDLGPRRLGLDDDRVLFVGEQDGAAGGEEKREDADEEYKSIHSSPDAAETSRHAGGQPPRLQVPQHFLNFFPLPQRQGSFRPTFGDADGRGFCPPSS